MVVAFFGASINVLTLLAVVLAIGIVVDDAIVEIENIHRRIEDGQPPLLASFDGAREIGFAVIATTATLMAVFVPLAFMTGNTGRLFREFAIQLAAAIFFSGVVARTLTPMMCSKLMVPAHGRIHRWTEPVFDGMTNGYRWLLSRALERAAGLPGDRRGRVASPPSTCSRRCRRSSRRSRTAAYIIIPINAPEGSSLDYTRERVKEVEQALEPLRASAASSRPLLSHVAPGFQRPAPVNDGIVIVRLVPWDERTVKQQDVVKQLSRAWSRPFPARAPSRSTRRSLGQRGFGQQQIQFVIGGPDYADPAGLARPRHRSGRSRPGSSSTSIPTTRRTQPDLRVQIDRARAADLGVSVEDIGKTLELMFGEREVSTFVNRGEEYQVIMRARARGPRLARRPRQHLRARARPAISSPSPPSCP